MYGGVGCGKIPLALTVIPAEAGIQLIKVMFGLDPSVRWDDDIDNERPTDYESVGLSFGLSTSARAIRIQETFP